ncbi:MAG: hypothetical protein BWY15_02424 [Firmicutes bacterium ADurb.Bin193]|nr:MAG: hypothetical protein BWY15_02424 [Firmicutes bacterium ADurb.Bin193]
MKLLKVLVSGILAAALLGVSAFAMPDVVWPGDGGNTADLIVITKPPKDRSATFDRSYVISGYGKEGTTVAIYKLTGDYYTKTEYEWTIGASTFFAVPIELEGRKNILLVRAEDASGQNQNVKLEITYLGSNLQDMFSGITVNPMNIPF